MIPELVQTPPPDSVPITTTTEPRVNPNDTTRVQEGQSSVTAVREATALTEEAISTIQEDIAKDLSEIAACHKEEVNRLM